MMSIWIILVLESYILLFVLHLILWGLFAFFSAKYRQITNKLEKKTILDSIKEDQEKVRKEGPMKIWSTQTELAKYAFFSEKKYDELFRKNYSNKKLNNINNKELIESYNKFKKIYKIYAKNFAIFSIYTILIVTSGIIYYYFIM